MQFIVGTGGRSHDLFPEAPFPTSEVRNNVTYGVLKLTLSQGSYGWEFLPVVGRRFTDTGMQSCH